LAFAMGEKGFDPRKPARDGARTDPLGPSRGQEGAEIGGAQGFEVVERQRAAKMARKEGEELVEVAAIGLDGLGRDAAHRCEVAAPVRDGPGERGVDGEGCVGHVLNASEKVLPSAKAATISRIASLPY